MVASKNILIKNCGETMYDLLFYCHMVKDNNNNNNGNNNKSSSNSNSKNNKNNGNISGARSRFLYRRKHQILDQILNDHILCSTQHEVRSGLSLLHRLSMNYNKCIKNDYKNLLFGLFDAIEHFDRFELRLVFSTICQISITVDSSNEIEIDSTLAILLRKMIEQTTDYKRNEIGIIGYLSIVGVLGTQFNIGSSGNNNNSKTKRKQNSNNNRNKPRIGNGNKNSGSGSDIGKDLEQNAISQAREIIKNKILKCASKNISLFSFICDEFSILISQNTYLLDEEKQHQGGEYDGMRNDNIYYHGGNGQQRNLRLNESIIKLIYYDWAFPNLKYLCFYDKRQFDQPIEENEENTDNQVSQQQQQSLHDKDENENGNENDNEVENDNENDNENENENNNGDENGKGKGKSAEYTQIMFKTQEQQANRNNIQFWDWISLNGSGSVDNSSNNNNNNNTGKNSNRNNSMANIDDEEDSDVDVDTDMKMNVLTEDSTESDDVDFGDLSVSITPVIHSCMKSLLWSMASLYRCFGVCCMALRGNLDEIILTLKAPLVMFREINDDMFQDDGEMTGLSYANRTYYNTDNENENDNDNGNGNGNGNSNEENENNNNHNDENENENGDGENKMVLVHYQENIDSIMSTSKLPYLEKETRQSFGDSLFIAINWLRESIGVFCCDLMFSGKMGRNGNPTTTKQELLTLLCVRIDHLLCFEILMNRLMQFSHRFMPCMVPNQTQNNIYNQSPIWKRKLLNKNIKSAVAIKAEQENEQEQSSSASEESEQAATDDDNDNDNDNDGDSDDDDVRRKKKKRKKKNKKNKKKKKKKAKKKANGNNNKNKNKKCKTKAIDRIKPYFRDLDFSCCVLFECRLAEIVLCENEFKLYCLIAQRQSLDKNDNYLAQMEPLLTVKSLHFIMKQFCNKFDRLCNDQANVRGGFGCGNMMVTAGSGGNVLLDWMTPEKFVLKWHKLFGYLGQHLIDLKVLSKRIRGYQNSMNFGPDDDGDENDENENDENTVSVIKRTYYEEIYPLIDECYLMAINSIMQLFKCKSLKLRENTRMFNILVRQLSVKYLDLTDVVKENNSDIIMAGVGMKRKGDDNDGNNDNDNGNGNGDGNNNNDYAMFDVDIDENIGEIDGVFKLFEIILKPSMKNLITAVKCIELMELFIKKLRSNNRIRGVLSSQLSKLCKETLCNDFYGHGHPKTNKTVGKLVELYILYSDSIQKTIFKLFHNAINKIDNGNPFYITLTKQNYHVYLKPMCDILVNKIANIKLINDIDANKNNVNRGRGRIKKSLHNKKNDNNIVEANMEAWNELDKYNLCFSEIVTFANHCNTTNNPTIKTWNIVLQCGTSYMDKITKKFGQFNKIWQNNNERVQQTIKQIQTCMRSLNELADHITKVYKNSDKYDIVKKNKIILNKNRQILDKIPRLREKMNHFVNETHKLYSDKDIVKGVELRQLRRRPRHLASRDGRQNQGKNKRRNKKDDDEADQEDEDDGDDDGNENENENEDDQVAEASQSQSVEPIPTETDSDENESDNARKNQNRKKARDKKIKEKQKKQKRKGKKQQNEQVEDDNDNNDNDNDDDRNDDESGDEDEDEVQVSENEKEKQREKQRQRRQESAQKKARKKQRQGKATRGRGRAKFKAPKIVNKKT